MNRPSALSLRPARHDQARVLAEMSRDLIEVGLPWRYTPARMAALMAQVETQALVASEGPDVQGFALMHFGELDAHLALLCVRSGQRRRGIGRSLVDWLAASARVAGADAIELELRADNPGALAFYRSLGFQEVQWLPSYYGDHVAARRMRLVLRQDARSG